MLYIKIIDQLRPATLRFLKKPPAKMFIVYYVIQTFKSPIQKLLNIEQVIEDHTQILVLYLVRASLHTAKGPKKSLLRGCRSALKIRAVTIPYELKST